MGWTPLVLTIEPRGVAYKNEDLCRQIPDHVRVYRTLDIDPAKWIARRPRLRRNSQAASPSIQTANDQVPPSRASRIWKRLKRQIDALLTDSPDSHIFWVPLAFLKGARVLLKEKVDVIYCSSPPHSSHIIAFLLAKCFGKPYIIDFRDPWCVTGSRRSPNKKISWVLKWETLMKRALINQAARIICATEGERDELAEELPELKSAHFTFITNGYDPTDFSELRVSKKFSTKLTLTHAGTIYGGWGGELFEALQRLIRSHPGIEGRMQVQLLGEIADEYAEPIRILEAGGIVRNYGLQPHATALRMVMESDVLIILLGGHQDLQSHIPAKVFEYLHAGKPILAISRDGELAEIVRKSGLGILVSPDDIEKLVDTLWRLCEDYTAGGLTRVPNNSYIRSFERSALTEKLAGILEEVKGDVGTVWS